MIISIGIVEACHAALNSVWSFYLLRLLLGIVEAGLWPGMTYYLSLYYPPNRMATRIGYYFTAAQLSAAVVGLVSAGFQEMDGKGLLGWQWMFLIYGVLTFLDGLGTLWWLPSRPWRGAASSSGSSNWFKRMWEMTVPQKPALEGAEAELHRNDMQSNGFSSCVESWGLRDLGRVLLSIELWPLIIMYFGVVGVGVGIQNYGSIIISAINPAFTSIQLSLLFAPIWIVCEYICELCY